ncbi:MAG: phage head closure protein [Bauldia sp.]|uniref:phage head closure protein n=1 Tax=Bauldia sp. TaxID=2575872 RepID=UPI001DF712F7|nr:phage head closure protein [Bauldia sp.]MCB1497955.1 phage head closure protein [Bauldia sp.]
MSGGGFDPGLLRHRLVIESAAGAPDGAGGEAVTWDTFATVWARIAPTASGEEIVAGHLSGIVSHTITMRYRADIAGGMRALHRGRIFRILVVTDPDERRRYIVAKAEEEGP